MPSGIYKHKKGYRISEDGRKNMSQSRIGHLVSQETRIKISKAHIGKKMSEESRKKMSLAKRGIPRFSNRGEKNWNWRGGTSRGYKDGYYSMEYREWRLSVFNRDGFTCQGCRQVGGNITAHHIKSFRHYPELRFVKDNGITLCEKCHKLTDNYGGNSKGFNHKTT